VKRHRKGLQHPKQVKREFFEDCKALAEFLTKTGILLLLLKCCTASDDPRSFNSELKASRKALSPVPMRYFLIISDLERLTIEARQDRIDRETTNVPC
jgi:hypothetical protein